MVTALLGVFIYAHIALDEASRPTAPKSPGGVVIVAFLMLVVPGLFVALGSYVQVMRRKLWGSPLVLIGGVLNFFFVVLNAGLAYAFVQDVWGQRAVFADLVAVIFTLATALINALVSMVSRNRL
jgi:hypothetical protein